MIAHFIADLLANLAAVEGLTCGVTLGQSGPGMASPTIPLPGDRLSLQECVCVCVCM